jgi:cell division protein FtsL
MITCCEIALTLALTNIISLVIFAGYTLRVSRRTLKLEKKNGHEREQLNQLKKEVERLKSSQRLKKKEI